MIKKLLASAAMALALATSAVADTGTHWVIIGHFSEDTAQIPRLGMLGEKLGAAMTQAGMTFGDRVTFHGTQGAPKDWFADFTLSARAGQPKPGHVAAFIEARMAELGAATGRDGSVLWWELEKLPQLADCAARNTKVMVITNGYSATRRTSDGRLYGAGVKPDSWRSCHVVVLGLGLNAPEGTTLNNRRELESVFEQTATKAGAESYVVQH